MLTKKPLLIIDLDQQLDTNAFLWQVDPVLGHTLFDPDKLLKLNGGSPALNMTGFQKLASKAGAPDKPKPEPDTLPPFPKSISNNSKDFKVFEDIPTLAGVQSDIHIQNSLH